MSSYTFISHSSKDKAIVTELAEILKQENVWYDTWNIDLGDLLDEKIEKGIDNAKIFLIILSRNSIESRWVRFELNMALIKYLENENYRIVVARIDDVEVPLRLKPFLRIDNLQKSDNIALNIARGLQTGGIIKVKSFKRQFVNRATEISNLSDIFYDPEIKFLSIIGFFGIGKTSLVKEVLKRVFNNPTIAEVNLSPAHFGSRLTLELCSKADVPLPNDGAPQTELDALNILCIEKLLINNAFIILNKFDEVLGDYGAPNTDFNTLFKYFETSRALNNKPIILVSRRWPQFDSIDKNTISFFKVRGLSSKHLFQILKSEIERTDPEFIVEEDMLHRIAENLHGYPLAGRLAAPMIVKYGIEYLFENLHLMQQLKIDIAEDIIAKLNLNSIQLDILEVLAIFESPLETYHLSEVLSLTSEELLEHIEILVSLNLIESIGKGLVLHPLINDFYLKLARSNQNFQSFADKLANVAFQTFKQLEVTDRGYVFWLTNTCRLLFYSGKYEEGRNLRRDLVGELKLAAIRLYQRQDYSSSLEFCNEYLDAVPNDKDILFTKARCLSRLNKLNESVKILKDLISRETNNFLLSKYNYGLGRCYIENSQEDTDRLSTASKYFLESIRINEHQAALQSMAELLFRQEHFEEAASFIDRKLQIAPTDPFALSIYSDILWKLDRKPEAIEKIIESLKHQPKNPNFWFRAGRFLHEMDRLEDAHTYFSNAIKYDSTYLDALLSLTDVCLDLGRIEEATINIEKLEQRIKGDKRSVLDSIKANLEIKKGNLTEAEKIANKLLSGSRNAHNLGLSAKIYIQKFRDSTFKGTVIYADTFKSKALDLINEGLVLEPNNVILINMKQSLG